MAYDPSKPANNSPVSSAELRTQLTGLKTLIDACPTTRAMEGYVSTNAAGPFTTVEYPSFTISNPPTQAEVQALLDLVVALLDAGRRA